MENNHCVVIFVKSPEPGMVKSRLAATISVSTALELYKCFVNDTIEMIAHGGYSSSIFFHPPESRQKIIQWLGEKYSLLPQEGNDLGEKMKNAFKTVFSQGKKSAILIGSDSPDLPDHIIKNAMESLDNHDAVLGPSFDGGYYLIGFRTDTFLPQVFDKIHWSTSDVFAQTMDILFKANLSVHILPEWRDVDTFDDLKALFFDSRNKLFIGSTTMKYLQENKLFKDLTLQNPFG